MTATTLAGDDLKDVTDFAERESAKSRKWATRLGLGAAGLAAAAVAAPLLGAAAIVGTIGLIGGGVLALSAASYALNAREMNNAKEGAGKEGFVESLDARAQKLKKFSRRTNLIALAGISVVILSALPVLAGAAAALHAVGMVGWIGGVFANAIANESDDSTGKLSRFAAGRAATAAPETAPPPAAVSGTPGLTAAPSPAPAFGLAANANEAKPEAAQKKTGWRSKFGL